MSDVSAKQNDNDFQRGEADRRRLEQLAGDRTAQQYGEMCGEESPWGSLPVSKDGRPLDPMQPYLSVSLINSVYLIQLHPP